MKASYNKSKIMRNAWYMIKVKMVKTFAAALRKAWFNEKLNRFRAQAEGCTLTQNTLTQNTLAEGKAAGYNSGAVSAAFVAGCLDYYANARRGRYMGD